MKKVILVANQCETLPYNSEYEYIGVDKGALYCLKHRIPMKMAIGDFDSLNKEEFNLLKENCTTISLPCRKNETDGEYALRYVYEQGYRDIEIYGVTGGRLDHYLIIQKLLEIGDISFQIVDKQNRIYVLEKGKYKIPKRSKYISFFALEELWITLKNVEYPLDHVFISPKDLYLTSNEIIDEANLEVSGRILVIESKDANEL